MLAASVCVCLISICPSVAPPASLSLPLCSSLSLPVCLSHCLSLSLAKGKEEEEEED